MKLFKFLFFSVIVLIAGLGYYIYTQNQLKIPDSMVKSAVASKFPIEKSYPLGKIKLFNPKVHFENDKLIIEAEYLNDALNDQISGTMTFATDIRYDPMKSNLYLEDFQIVKLTKENKEIDLDKKPIIRTGLNYAFSQLEKKEILNLSGVEKFQMIKDIKIENNICKISMNICFFYYFLFTSVYLSRGIKRHTSALPLYAKLSFRTKIELAFEYRLF